MGKRQKSRIGIQKGSRQQAYNQKLQAAENLLLSTRESLQAEADQQQRIVETNLILTELLYCADRLQAVYEKHLAWLEAGGSGGQQDSRTAPSHQHGQDGQDSRMRPVPLLEQRDDAHWVLYLLETATWEQLQQVLAMTTQDWVSYHRQYCTDLIRLMEVSQRCPEVQDIMLAGVTVQKPSAQDMPTAATGFASSTSNAGADSGSSGMSDGSSSTPAFEVILHMLKTTGSLAYIALLHGLASIFDAPTKNVLTGEECVAPPSHWASVAQRMRFTRLQKLHFKLALQNFARQARAAAAQGLSLLQETPSYAFLLACQDIAERQLSRQEGSPQATSDAEAAAQQSTGDATAAGVQGLSSSRAASVSHAAGSAGGMGSACSLAATASAGTAAAGPGVAGTGAASGAGAAAGAAAGPKPPAGDAAAAGVSAGQQQQFCRQEEEAMVDVDAAFSPTRKLQHQLGVFYRQVVNLNIFLADTLTVEQALLLNIASYPFWPLLAAVAEAAVQLPDEPEAPALQPGQQELQGQQGIQLLMRQRRSFMQQAHYEWFADYGRPGAAAPLLE